MVERLAEEILDRRRRGESPTVDEYCSQYPDHEEELRAFLPTLLAIENLKPASNDVTGSVGGVVSSGGKPLESVGGYRILRELGRGGMGGVYEAEQQGLGRRVALKVLADPAKGGDKAIARFQSEARAAARMHHTNIVPVFDVGQEDDCVFYLFARIDTVRDVDARRSFQRPRPTQPHRSDHEDRSAVTPFTRHLDPARSGNHHSEVDRQGPKVPLSIGQRDGRRSRSLRA